MSATPCYSSSRELEQKSSRPVPFSFTHSPPPHFTSRTMLGFSAAGDDNPRSGEGTEEVRRTTMATQVVSSPDADAAAAL